MKILNPRLIRQQTKLLNTVSSRQSSSNHQKQEGKEYVRGLGVIDRHVQGDGTHVITVMPSEYNRRKNRILPHIRIDGKTLSKKNFEEGRKDKAIKSTVTDQCVQGIEYYFEDGLRKVRPYYFIYDFLACYEPEESPTTLYNLMCSKFPFLNRDLLQYRISRGHVQVNMNKDTRSDQLVREGDFISHLVHLHEHEVLDRPVQILHEDNKMVVVNKPPSYLIHPSSSYRANSLLFVLKIEHGFDDLRTVHRLDKLTSGVCFFAKNYANVDEVRKSLQDAEKIYLALVDGEFPEGKIVCENPLNGFVVNSLGERLIYKRPKASKTEFERIRFDGRTSLVRCTLRTGRTHQIRLHLADLGFHIVNDDIYNPLDKRKKVQKDYSHIYQDVLRTLPRKLDLYALIDSGVEYECPDCVACALDKDFLRRSRAELVDTMFMCLHAWQYRLGSDVYEAEPPSWVEQDSSGDLDKVFERRMKLNL